MNTYDFDNTIFHGDSTVRFWLYCLRTRPRTALNLGRTVVHGLLFALKIEKKTDFKQRFYSFLAYLPDRDKALEEFWDKNISRVKQWYLDTKQDDDVIISASPEFLLRPACDRLGIRTLIASQVDPDSGEYSGVNCSGEEKPRRFREVCGDVQPDKFFSDSHSDDPMAKLARESFFVRGNKIDPWKF